MRPLLLLLVGVVAFTVFMTLIDSANAAKSAEDKLCKDRKALNGRSDCPQVRELTSQIRHPIFQVEYLCRNSLYKPLMKRECPGK